MITDRYALYWVMQCQFDPDLSVTYHHLAIELAGADELVFFFKLAGRQQIFDLSKS